jgi:23S rRNA (cytosine1962-C5)-methyltransferase
MAAPALAVVILVRGKDRAIRRRHPWIFSGAIGAVRGSPQPGDVVVVEDAHGEVLGRAHFSPSSQIRARMVSFGSDVSVDVDAVVAARVKDAVAYRKRHVLSARTTSARLIFAESDGLPGVVVDQYDDTAVIQCQSAGAERMRDVVVDAVVAAAGVARVYERSDAEIRTLEGLEPRKGLLRGKPLTGLVAMRENDLAFDVDVDAGHKTGFYLDQRDSRDLLRTVVSETPGARVLNCFCYTGGFSIAALKGGASSVVSVDASRPALELGEQNAKKNGFADGHDWVRGDCFDVLRGLFDDGERFDVVVLDPPKFASKAAHREKAARGYKDLLLRGLALTKPGGCVFTFSCSGAIDRGFFKEIAAQASLEARRPTQIVAELGHARCHPVSTSFPEGEYLKGLALRAP